MADPVVVNPFARNPYAPAEVVTSMVPDVSDVLVAIGAVALVMLSIVLVVRAYYTVRGLIEDYQDYKAWRAYEDEWGEYDRSQRDDWESED